jgi:hypothetical protein
MDTHEVDRREFAIGRGTGYHAAILDGKDPDDDLELVEIQARSANDYALNHADRAALRLLWGIADYEAIEHELLHPGDHNYEAMTRRVARQSDFNFSIQEWAAARQLVRLG